MRPYRSLYRRGLFVLTALLVLVGASSIGRSEVALAHPLGNFTINRYTRIELGAAQIYLTYVLDMAEIPTFQERARIDLDRDGTVDQKEYSAYLSTKADELKDELFLAINGSQIPLDVENQTLGFPPGLAGAPTLRISLLLLGSMQQSESYDTQDLYYRDDNYATRIGWKEIVVQPGNRVSLLQSTVPQHDKSDELRVYPQDQLSSPLDQREARSTFMVVGSGETQQPTVAPAITDPVEEPKDLLTSLVSAERLSLPVIAIALVVALGLGALHAVSPGHGKTIIAAYLVGARGTARHAIFLGLTVTISHTLGVLGLGLVVLYASNLIAPERLYPWLGLVSGAVIISIGVWLVVGRIRGSQVRTHTHHSQADGDSERSHRADGGASKLARYWPLRGSGMRLPHGHSHTTHDGRPNPVKQDQGGLRITWKSLTALGVVGGLLPSASALIILLAAISLHRIGFGVLMIFAFSAGMAGVLTTVGLLLVYTRRVVERVSIRAPLAAAIASRIPLITALVVLVSGLIVALRAAYQIGLV